MSTVRTPKKVLQKRQETLQKLAEHLQEGRSMIVEWTFASTAKNPTRQEIRKYAENKMEATIQNKMKLDEYDAYTAKETLG